MSIKPIDIIIIFCKVIFLVLSAITIYGLILKLTNHSPTIEQLLMSSTGILATLQIATLGILIKFMSETNRFRGRVEHHIKECDRRFYNLAKDWKNTDSHFRNHMIKYHKSKYA